MVSRFISVTGRYTLLLVILVLMTGPLIWMFRVSLLPVGTGLDMASVLRAGITIANFEDLFTAHRMGRFLFNSFFVGTAVTVGNLLFCFMVGYALARYRSLTNRLLFISIILVLMVPSHILIIPLYVLMVKAHLYDTYWALILPWLVNPIGIFLVKQYVEAIPSSMEEAARVDGAGDVWIVVRIVMPMCKPALAVLAIQVFFTNWNSFLFPYILTSSEDVRTLPVALALYQGHQAIDWQHLMAGAVIAVLPILILFIILQRQIISGITAGAVRQ